VVIYTIYLWLYIQYINVHLWLSTHIIYIYDNRTFSHRDAKKNVPCRPLAQRVAGESRSCPVPKSSVRSQIWEFQDPIYWRFLPYIRPIFRG
jgi:hypothetical protein